MNLNDVLAYPADSHERRHGPLGYVDYKSYKPWLRDEFTFRCVYCLWREAWCADGDSSFGVDHVRPRALHPEQSCDYDNLVYACCRCNSVKQDVLLPIDACAEAWGRHLDSLPDGTVRGITQAGEQTIAICRLNRPVLVQARRRMLQVLQELAVLGSEAGTSLLHEYLTFPANLPMLSKLHPPEGNARPDGIAASYFEQRRRGELPQTY